MGEKKLLLATKLHSLSARTRNENFGTPHATSLVLLIVAVASGGRIRGRAGGILTLALLLRLGSAVECLLM